MVTNTQRLLALAQFALLLSLLPGCLAKDNSLTGSIGRDVPLDVVSEEPTSSITYGETKDFTYKFTNSSTYHYSDIQFASLTSPFSIKTNQCSSKLPPGASCSITVSFTSPGDGTYKTSLDLQFNKDGEPQSLILPIEVKGQPVSTNVTKVYENHANWNDYVELSSSVDGLYGQTDTTCSTGPCIHAGLLHKAEVSGESDCSSLDAQDELSAFRWVCDDSTGAAVFYSPDLAKGKGLADLLDATGWKENRLNVLKGGRVIYQSSLAPWFSNPIALLPDNSSSAAETLNSAGTVYVLDSSRTTNGYIIGADRISLVLLNDSELTYAGSATDNCGTRICVVSATSQNFIWIEGAFNGQPSSGTQSEIGVYVSLGSWSRVHRVKAYNHSTYGIYHYLSSYDHITESMAYNNTDAGFYINQVDKPSYYKGIVTANNGGDGFRIRDAWNAPVHLYNVKSINNGNHGIYTYMGSQAYLVNILTAANQVSGIYSNDIWRSPFVLSHVSTLNNADKGLYLDENYQGNINQILAVNNGGNGVEDVNASDVAVSQIATSHNGGTGFLVSAFSTGLFSKNMLVGNNLSDCSVSGGTTPGIDGSCNSAATLFSGVDLSSTFSGKVTTDDAVNGSDADGLAAFSAALDWLFFESPLRLWGPESTGVLDSGARGACSSGNCRIWDFSLSSSDTQVYNRNRLVSTQNDSFSAGETCPRAVHGNQVQQANSQTFLVNAIEAVQDGEGDDDGLCESNEACIYTPHFGYHNLTKEDFSQTCTFEDGTITGVTMSSSF